MNGSDVLLESGEAVYMLGGRTQPNGARYIACARLKLVGRFVAEDVGIATGPRSFRLYIMADCHGLCARVRNRPAL
jgi:hypothetical protein